jgi:mono/diheme cytochrome c family protein
MKKIAAAVSAIVVLVSFSATPAAAQGAPEGERLVTQGTFTAPQAERGKVLFREQCGDCHPVSQFKGATFIRMWSGRRVFDLFDQIRTTMPGTSPGSLTRQQYADIVAFVLSENELPAGTAALPTDDDQLKRIRFAPRVTPEK